MGKARSRGGTSATREDRLNKATIRQSNLNRSQNKSTQTGSNPIPSHRYLRTDGGIMLGPRGNQADVLAISSGILDLKTNAASKTVKPRPIVFVDTETGTTDTLDAIDCDGEELNYQELRVIGIVGDTITVTHAFGSTTGTQRAIQCPDDADFTLSGNNVVDLQYDQTTENWLIVGGTGGGGVSVATNIPRYISASLSADQTTNIAATDHVEFDTVDADGTIVLQTGAGQLDGIFELKEDKTYKLSGQLRPEFSGATGELVVAWYDITNAAELGKRGIYNATSNTGNNANQPLPEIIVAPTTDITVELRIISVTALTALANEYCIANIMELAIGATADHLKYSYSGNTVVANPLPMPTVNESTSGSLITINSPTTDRVTLTGGKTYELLAHLAAVSEVAVNNYTYIWHDDTAAANVGQEGTAAVFASVGGTDVFMGFDNAHAIVTPATTRDYRLALVSGTGSILATHSFVLVKEVAIGRGGNVSFPIQPTINDQAAAWTSPVALDLSATTGHVHKFTIDADLTLTFTNPPASGTQHTFELELAHDGVGGTFTVTLPGTVNQLSTISVPLNSRGVYTFRTNDGGTTYDVVQVVDGTLGGGSEVFTWTADHDANANKLILDADGDSHIVADTDDQIEFFTAATEKLRITTEVQLQGGVNLDVNGNDVILDTATNTILRDNAGTFEVDVSGATHLSLDSNTLSTDTSIDMTGTGGSIDVNSNELILDLDGDTTIDAAVDDVIQVKIANFDVLQLSGNGSFTWNLTGLDHQLQALSTEMRMILGANTDDFILRFTDTAKETTFSDNAVLFVSDATSFTFDSLYAPTTPADGNVFAFYDHSFKNSIGTLESWGTLTWTAEDVTDGTEDSSATLSLFGDGVLTDMFTFRPETTSAKTPTMEVFEDDSTPSNGDIGLIKFYANNSTPTKTLFAQITAQVDDVTATSEDGALQLQVANAGTLGTIIEINAAAGADQLGFFGTAPVVQQTVASDTLANLYTALRASGIIG